MQRWNGLLVIALTMALLSACDKKEEPKKAAEPLASAAEQPKRGAPDFGGVAKVSREVEAIGSTPELAVVSALQSAVAQVNGVQVASQLQSLRQGLDVEVSGSPAVSVRADAFSQRMIAGSQGMVLGYEVLSQQEVDKLDEETVAKVRASDGGYSYVASAASDHSAKVSASASASNVDAQAAATYGGSTSSSEKTNVDINRGASSYSSDVSRRKMRSYWRVKLRADIAQYRAPDEKGRPKIVVVLPKTLLQRYPVGESNVSSEEVARAVRGRLSDILTQTRRFIVLDREFGDDVQAEIDHIDSGNVRAQDTARIGQQLATDLLLIPTIERFEYPKSVRKLRMSDRELVSYSGGGRITLRLINASTGQVVMSRSFEHKLLDAEPSTMPRVIDGKSMAAGMMDALSAQIGGAIVTEIFPVSVVALNGDQVVLSQGGESLQVGQRWKAVYLGEELKDPQTGNSLGRSETPVGTIHIDRVAAQISYGTLEEGLLNLGSKSFVPGAIELRGLAGKASASPVPKEKSNAAAPATAAVKSKSVKAVTSDSSAAGKPAVETAKDDKW